MSQTFVFRSQAIDAAKRAHKNFRTSQNEDGMWVFHYEPGESPAAGWDESRDYVRAVETAWVDGKKKGVLVITCFKEEIPADDFALIKAAGYLIEPVTPSLFAGDYPEPAPTTKRERKASTGEGRAASSVASPTKLVWEIADSMPGASRKEIIAACIEKGVHPATASTQYSKWNRSKST